MLLFLQMYWLCAHAESSMVKPALVLHFLLLLLFLLLGLLGLHASCACASTYMWYCPL
jgi:hypothetical protein